MQVACAEHLNLPSFATLEYKPGEKSELFHKCVPNALCV